mmetsp:Transcript_72553/g.224287  ORF Transcript_72553/g.224287 Transcript_72553/m.224287 type:complete len:247 (+) Transcript_72553:983-1723(+)
MLTERTPPALAHVGGVDFEAIHERRKEAEHGQDPADPGAAEARVEVPARLGVGPIGYRGLPAPYHCHRRPLPKRGDVDDHADGDPRAEEQTPARPVVAGLPTVTHVVLPHAEPADGARNHDQAREELVQRYVRQVVRNSPCHWEDHGTENGGHWQEDLGAVVKASPTQEEGVQQKHVQADAQRRVREHKRVFVAHELVGELLAKDLKQVVVHHQALAVHGGVLRGTFCCVVGHVRHRSAFPVEGEL